MTRLVAVLMHSEISITHKLMLFSTVGDFELLSFPCAWLEEAARAVHRFERSWHNLLIKATATALAERTTSSLQKQILFKTCVRDIDPPNDSSSR